MQALVIYQKNHKKNTHASSWRNSVRDDGSPVKLSVFPSLVESYFPKSNSDSNFSVCYSVVCHYSLTHLWGSMTLCWIQQWKHVSPCRWSLCPFSQVLLPFLLPSLIIPQCFYHTQVSWFTCWCESLSNSCVCYQNSFIQITLWIPFNIATIYFYLFFPSLSMLSGVIII